jgi:hypothetical protein
MANLGRKGGSQGSRIIRSLAALILPAGMLTAATLAAIVAGQTPAGAATCGVALGTPVLSAGAGNGDFLVPVNPTVPGESCTTTISVVGAIVGLNGLAPSNVNGNGALYNVKVTELPSQPSPVIDWHWGPRCADPANPTYAFRVNSPTAGSVVLTNVANSTSPCADFGVASSTLLAPVVLLGNPNLYVGFSPTPDNLGYWLVTAGGGSAHFGDAANLSIFQNGPAMVGAATAGQGGFWMAASDGGVFTLGNGLFYGSMGGKALNAPVVGIAATPDRGGYWLVASDGGVFSFGDAKFFGSVPGQLKPGQSLNKPAVGIVPTPTGNGYWVVAADGGVFSFGDAVFHGSVPGQLKPGQSLNAPVVGGAGNGMGGYWLVAGDGGVFSFDAAFLGSLGGKALNAPITAMAATSTGNGYWLMGGDGGVFAFAGAPFLGSAA